MKRHIFSMWNSVFFTLHPSPPHISIPKANKTAKHLASAPNSNTTQSAPHGRVPSHPRKHAYCLYLRQTTYLTGQHHCCCSCFAERGGCRFIKTRMHPSKSCLPRQQMVKLLKPPSTNQSTSSTTTTCSQQHSEPMQHRFLSYRHPITYSTDFQHRQLLHLCMYPQPSALPVAICISPALLRHHHNIARSTAAAAANYFIFVRHGAGGLAQSPEHGRKLVGLVPLLLSTPAADVVC